MIAPARLFPICFLVLSLAVLPLYGAEAPASLHVRAEHGNAECHPSDGPDVDLRVRLEEGRVTLQAIMNLAFCDEVAGTPRSSDEGLTDRELARLDRDLRKVFAREVTLAVDGIDVSPIEHECVLLPFDPALAENFPQLGMLAVIKVRLTLTYSLKTDPAEVGLTWRLHPIDTALADFVETPIEVKAEWTAFGDVSIVDLPDDEPTYVWRAATAPPRRDFFAVPEAPAIARSEPSLLPFIVGGMVFLIGAVLMGTAGVVRARRVIGAVLIVPAMVLVSYGALANGDEAPTARAPETEDATQIFNALHGNIYRAFDYGEENEVYDALARSVSGELLDAVYNEVYRSLVLQEHGGAVCRVDEVSRLETKVGNTSDDAPVASFTADTRWRVRGQVYHWGHTHERTNEYRAEYRVAPKKAGWRIDRARVIEQFRVSATNNGAAEEAR